MKVSKIFKHTATGFAVYALSPFVQVGVVDRARATGESILTQQNMYEMEAPYIIKDSALLYAVMSDGTNISDPFNFWKAKFHPKTNNYMCPSEMNRYNGAVEWAVQDNAYWLSKVTGVDAEKLLPEKDDYRYEQAINIHFVDRMKDESTNTGRVYGGELPDVPQRSCT